VDPSLSWVHIVLGARIEGFFELGNYLGLFGYSVQYMMVRL
jgi:hypothetical protein